MRQSYKKKDYSGESTVVITFGAQEIEFKSKQTDKVRECEKQENV